MTVTSKQSAMDGRGSTCTSVDRGFTLLELMIVVAIIGILLAIGVPGMSNLVLNSQRSSALNELVSTLSYARSEAVTRHRSVGVCRSIGDIGAPTCAKAHADGGWENGWIVYVDDNLDGVFEPDEELLREHQALALGATLRGNSKLADAVSFNDTGGTGDNGRLVYCDKRGWSNDVRLIVIATTGRARITTVALDKNTPLKSCLR